MPASPQDLTTVAAVKADIATSSTVDDTLIQAVITAASGVIMDTMEREFAPATPSATRRFRVEGPIVDLAPWDLRSASAVTLHPEDSSPTVLVAGTDYVLDPVDTRHGVYTAVELSELLAVTSTFQRRFGYAQIDVSGAWGFAAVPDGVEQACIETVQSWLRADPSGWSEVVPTQTREFASRGQGTYAIPMSALRMLNPFRRYVSIV